MAGLKPNPRSVFPVPNQVDCGAEKLHTGVGASLAGLLVLSNPRESPVSESIITGVTPPCLLANIRLPVEGFKVRPLSVFPIPNQLLVGACILHRVSTWADKFVLGTNEIVISRIHAKNPLYFTLLYCFFIVYLMSHIAMDVMVIVYWIDLFNVIYSGTCTIV